MMSVSFLAQGTGRKLITGFLLFVFTVSSVMPGYAAGDHLRPPAVKNRKLYSTLQQNLGAMLDGGVLSGEDIVHLKANLGANAVLGVSAAAVRVAAAAHRMPVYQYIAEHLGNRVGQFTNQEYLKALQNIYPEMNIMNGGVHAGWVTDIQEFMILVGMGVEMPFWKRMEIANEVVNALTGIYKDPKALSDILGRKVEKPFSTLVGDEGGYAPELQGNEEAFKLMAAAIERSGYAKEVRIAIDAAISDRYVEKTQSYDLKSEKRILSRQEWITQLKQWFDKYHVAAAEDICAETDHVGWRQAYKAVGGTMTVVGDDLTVTNLDLLKQSIARNAEEINTILIKINQNGSISGTIDVIQFALSHGISVSISHRSGETEDDLISDLAVASNLFEKKAHPVTGKMPVVMLKTGGFRRTDRMVKYNRLLAIESEIEESIRGGNARPAQKVDIGTQTVISGVRAVEVYDSRGNPTVQVVMRLSNGYEAGNTVPSGASTGIRESIELRDGQIAKTDPQRVTQALVNRIMPGMTVERALKELSTRVGGKGVQIAVDNVNHLIAPSIVAARINAAKIDSLQGLKKLDGIMFDLELALAETKKMYSTMNRFFGLTKEQGTALDAKLARVSFDGKENRLGWTPAMFDWIFSPEGRAAVDNVLADADTIKRQYKYVIFCGMGGSGLSVQAVKTIFGENEGVRIYSLRTTDPAVIKDILDQIAGHEGGSLDKALEKTLIIPISKSGTTLETKTHKEYFEKLLSDRKMDIAKHMWVVTDKGSPLDIGVYPQREIQLNGKGDVGGRFTAPTTRVFLAPLSLVAHDKVWPILERTRGMIDGKDKNLSLDSFIAFGRRAYELASKEHKDKLTLILPDALKDFSIWSEQLVEESLGHDGKGVTVLYREDLSPEVLKSAADNDRFFVRVNIGGKQTRGDLWKYLTDNKYPVQEFNVADTTDIGSLMLGFQMAVATVGYLWDICYVDQPGVEGYKKATRAVQDKLGAGAIVQVPSEWTSGKFRGLNVHYGTLLQAGVLTLAELEAETVRLGGSMSDMPVVYAAALNLLRGKFELAEIASYGRLTPSTRKVFEDARYAIFTRDLQKTSKLGEGPDKNHSYHQNIAQGRDIFNSLYFMPLVMEQPELAYDDNLIRAQTVGTIQSLVDTGRKVVLITADSTADAAAADLRRFFNRVDIVLRGAEGKDGGVVTGQAINVLSTLFSLQEGAQTGGYNIEHAIMEGADGFILNHSDPRGRMANKMENLLRGVRDLLNQKASPATIEKLWVATLKTENLSDEQIAEMRTILDGFTGNRRTQSAIELRARQLVNKVVNFQLKKIVAYSDKYTFRQVVLCVGETRAQKDSGLTQQVLGQDISEILDGITAAQAARINLRQAYEPRWAINQKPAITPDPQNDIQPTHRFIKDTTNRVLHSELAVDYGGSLNDENAPVILPLPDVNGGLIGGAAKQPKKIGSVIDTAIEVGQKTGKLLNIGMNWKAENEASGLAGIPEFAELFNSKDLTKVQITLSTPIVSKVRSSLAAAGVKDGGMASVSDTDLAYRISWIMNDLKSWNMDTYDLAMKKLVLIGAPAVPYLVGALTNTDSRVRARAVSVLWAINDPSAIGQVISLLGNKDERIVESARAVILNYYSAAIPALEAAAKASDPLTRKQIDGLLELIRASSAKDGGIRSVLRDIRNSIMIGLLYADLFNYSDDQLRRDAVVQLGELHDIRTTGLLIEALNDWDASVRRSAADALGDQGDVRAKTALEKRLNDDSPAVRESVKLALRKIDNVSSQETVVRDGGIAGEVKQRVDDIVQTRRVKQLIGQLDGPGVEAAEDELVKIGSSAVDSLKAALWVNRSNDALCVNIIRVLGKIGTHDAMKSLIPLLRNSAKSIRVETVKAVAGFNDPAVINALIFLQRNEYDKEVRQQISAVLAAKGDLKSIDPMAGVAEVTKKPVQGKDGGQKTRIAVIGGATGAIGVPLVQRLRANGEVEVLAGTSRSPDPARNIFSNKDAAAQADIVIVAVPAEYVKSTVRDIVPVMKQGSILLSMGVPMEAVSYKDQDGKDLKKRVYSAPEGFGSAAEEVAAIVKEQQGHGAIHVVAAMHNVPGEWYGDADLELNQQVLVSGDNAIACSVVANQVIKQISKLEPVIVNDLAQSRYSEGLTSAIIASKKELLAEGSRPLTELIDFIRKNGVDVETSSIVAFNREVLELAFVKMPRPS